MAATARIEQTDTSPPSIYLTLQKHLTSGGPLGKQLDFLHLIEEHLGKFMK